MITIKIIATDLDRTLLPNGKWKKDDKAISTFNKLTSEQDILLIYVTGRNLKLTEDAIKKYNIRYPDILIGDVGTTIRDYKDDKWIVDNDWIKHICKHNPKWNQKNIISRLKNIKGLTEQEKSNQNTFKQSYYLDPKKKDIILKEVSKVLNGNFNEKIIYSIDTKINKGLLDILPACATKKTALLYIMKKYEFAFNDILYCGDSGNDILPLTTGFYSVIVKNGNKETT